MPAIWYNILWEPNRRKKEKLFSSVYLRLDDLRFTIEATVHCLYFHFYSFICLSFHSFPYPAPSVTAERSCSLFFGEPDDRCLAYDVVFGDETEKTGVRKIDGIVGTYPVVVFGKMAVLHGFAFHIKGVVFDFGLFLFVKYQGISQQSLVPRIYAHGFAFAGDYQRFQYLHRIFLDNRFYPAVPVHGLFQQVVFITAETAYLLC